MNTKQEILIADDHSIIKKGLEIIIKTILKDYTLHFSEDYSSTIEVIKNKKINFLILDVSFKERKSLDIVSYCKNFHPEIKILIFSMHEEIEIISRYIKEGADGYLFKTSQSEEMENALKTFFLKGKYLSSNTKEKLIDSIYLQKKDNPLKALSNREYEICKLLILGKNNVEISMILGIKNSTISTFKKRIFEKLKINSIISLIEIFNHYD